MAGWKITFETREEEEEVLGCKKEASSVVGCDDATGGVRLHANKGKVAG